VNEDTGLKECIAGTINPYYANTLYMDEATKSFWSDQTLVADSFDTTEYENWQNQYGADLTSPEDLPDDTETMKLLHYTLIFHVFVFLQVWNLINARKLKKEDGACSVFKGFCNNPIFFIIFFLEIALQWAIVAVGGRFFKTYPLDLNMNLICLGIGSTMIPVGMIVRCMPAKCFKDVGCL
jgi:hypothetical protein